MKRLNLPSFIASAVLLASVLTARTDEPIRLHPENPHYFLWRGQPTVLITAGEHYGAVMNLDFDGVRYLDELKANRFNLTRVFSGTYREVAGSFNIARNEPFRGKDKELLAIEKAMVTKLVTELNDFDNLYFEVCNEPYERGGLTKDWNDQIIAAIADAEAVLPKKHLIAQNFPPSSAAVAELNGRVSLLNFHAAKTDSVRLNYSFNRVIAFDETGGADRSDRKYRTEGWEWIVAGGGVYDHLDFSFTTARPDGSAVPLPLGTPGGGGPALRRQLRILKEFIESFEFVRMKPDNTTIKRNHITLPQAGGSRVSSNATVRALSEAGRTYAIYVKGGNQAELLLELPAATYKAEWIDTKTGRSGKSETFNHAGGNKSFV